MKKILCIVLILALGVVVADNDAINSAFIAGDWDTTIATGLTPQTEITSQALNQKFEALNNKINGLDTLIHFGTYTRLSSTSRWGKFIKMDFAKFPNKEVRYSTTNTNSKKIFFRTEMHVDTQESCEAAGAVWDEPFPGFGNCLVTNLSENSCINAGLIWNISDSECTTAHYIGLLELEGIVGDQEDQDAADDQVNYFNNLCTSGVITCIGI